MVTEQTIDTKRIMKQFYLSILCLAFIAGATASRYFDVTSHWTV